MHLHKKLLAYESGKPEAKPAGIDFRNSHDPNLSHLRAQHPAVHPQALTAHPTVPTMSYAAPRTHIFQDTLTKKYS